MARVTVEDCLRQVDNHFALVVLAAERARQIAAGGTRLVVCTNKPAVTALREIGAGKVRFNENVADTVRAFVIERKQIDGETRIATKQRRHGGQGTRASAPSRSPRADCSASYFAPPSLSGSRGMPSTDGMFMMSFRAAFHAFWTIHESERS